jgi:hypothetical protein
MAQITKAGRGGSVNIGGTTYQGNFGDSSGGEAGAGQGNALEGYYATMPGGGMGTPFAQYDPSGQYTGAGTQQKVSYNAVKPLAAMAAMAYGLPPGLGEAANVSNVAALGGNQVAALSPAEGGGFFSNLFGSGAPQALGEAGGYGAGAGAGAGAGLFGAGASNYLIPGAILGSSLIGAGAAKSAANTQAAAQQQANQLLAQQYQQQRADLQPYSAAGVNALSKFQGMADYTPFGTSQFQADPGYAFRLSEGQKALERSAAARGGLLSGGTGKRIAAYGQEAASQEYNNAFNRYQTERAAKLAPYQSLINTGQASAAGQANAAGNYGVQAGQGLTNIGGAQAAGTMGGANALASGLGQYLNYNANQDLATAVRQSGYGR